MPTIIPSYRIYSNENDKCNDNVIKNVNLGAQTILPESYSLLNKNCIFLDKKEVCDAYVMSTSPQTPENSNSLDYNYVTVGGSDSLASITPNINTLYRIQYNNNTYYYRYDENSESLIKTYLVNPNSGNYELVINDTYTPPVAIGNTYYNAIAYDKRSRWRGATASSGFPTPYATEAFDYLVNPQENTVYKVMVYEDDSSKRWTESRLIYSEGKFLSMLPSNALGYEKDKNLYYLTRAISQNINDEMSATYLQSNSTSSYTTIIRLSLTAERDYLASMSSSLLQINATIKGDTPDFVIQSRFTEYDENDGASIQSSSGDVFVGITYNRNAFSSVFITGGIPSIANMRGKRAIISLSVYFDNNSQKYMYRLDLLASCFNVRADGSDYYTYGRNPVTEIDLEITTQQLKTQEENDAQTEDIYYYQNNSSLNNASNYINNTMSAEIIADYQNGKETATLRVSVNDYYDDDENLVLSINDPSKPMLFHNGDIVVPYVATPNGDRPMSILPDGTAKPFRITGVTLVSDGAIWQELQVQEVSG